MFIYIVILSFLVILSCIEPFIIRNKAVKYVFIFLCILLIVLSGLRYDVGVDYMNYKEMYDDATILNENQKEFVLAKIFHYCKVNDIPFQIIIFSFAFWTVGLTFRAIGKYSPFTFLSVLIFFCFGQYYYNTFNAVRQTLAIYLFFNLLDCAIRGKWKIYFLLLLLSIVLVHASAILLFPLYFILHKEFSLKLKILMLIAVLFLKPVFIQLISLSSYAIYLKFDMFVSGVSISTYCLLIFALFFFYLDFKKKKLVVDKKLNAVFFNLNYLSLFMLLLVTMFANTPLIMVANRFSYYFTPVYILLIPLYISQFSRQSNRAVLVVICSILFSLVCYMTLSLNGESSKIVPYQTIFK